VAIRRISSRFVVWSSCKVIAPSFSLESDVYAHPSSPRTSRLQATLAWISRRIALIRRIARARPASVVPSSYS
jgi:hypothetical protein